MVVDIEEVKEAVSEILTVLCLVLGCVQLVLLILLFCGVEVLPLVLHMLVTTAALRVYPAYRILV